MAALMLTLTGKSCCHTTTPRSPPPPTPLCLAVRVCVRAGGSHEHLMRASYLEVYNEEIRDLLSKSPQARLELKEHPERGVYVRGLMQFVVKSVAEITSVLQVWLAGDRETLWRGGAAGASACASCQHPVGEVGQPLRAWQLRSHTRMRLQVGKKNRMVGATMMNQDSSRSHSIFTVTIEATARVDAATTTAAAAAAGAAAGSDAGAVCFVSVSVCAIIGITQRSSAPSLPRRGTRPPPTTPTTTTHTLPLVPPPFPGCLGTPSPPQRRPQAASVWANSTSSTSLAASGRARRAPQATASRRASRSTCP